MKNFLGTQAVKVFGIFLITAFVFSFGFASISRTSAQEADGGSAPTEEVSAPADASSDVTTDTTEVTAPADDTVVAPVEETTSTEEVTVPSDETVVEDTTTTEEVAPVTTDETTVTPTETTTTEEVVVPVVEEVAPVQSPELSITPDQPEYYPNQNISIVGKFFNAVTNFVLNIFGSNEDGSTYVAEPIPVTSNADGSFSAPFTLDSVVHPLYTIVANALSGEELARTTFLDPYNGGGNLDQFSQCANDDGDGYTGADIGCHWTNGDLNASNSTYHEDDATVQRLAIKDLINGDHYAIIKYSTTKGGKHSYDFMTDDNYSELAPNSLLASDLCDPAISNLANCSSLAAVPSGFIPTDLNAAGHDVARANRHFKIRNGTWVAGGIASGPTLLTGTYAGDSDTIIRVAFHVDTATCANKYQKQGTDVCEVLITWGAHVSSQADWGAGNSAVNINGSPYHVQLANIDNPATTGGGNDNQMSATAIVVVPQEIASVVTAIHNSSHNTVTSVAPSTTVHDSVVVSGSAGTPTGNVTFDFFNNGTCANTPAFTSGTFALSGGAVDATTFTQGPLATGSYSFLAHYAGDATYQASAGSCEPLTVSKASPTISTIPSAGGVIGTVLNDTATLSGGNSPTGNVTFKLFPPSDATCSGAASFTQVDGVSPYATTGGFASDAVGVWHWTADYAGDANNNAVSSPCAAETATITKATPTLSTDIHDGSHGTVTAVALGSTVHDKAAISGGSNPTGTVDFTFYNNNSCSNSGSASGTGVALTAGVADPSANQGPLAAGLYSFKAHYNGDANNNAVDAACEPLTVNKAKLEVTTKIHNASHADVTGSSVALGSVLHDTATITGAVNGFPIPAISFTLNTVGVANGSEIGYDAATVDSTPLVAGAYTYVATVASNSNYDGDVGADENVTVNKGQLSISTDIHNAVHGIVTSVPLGSIVHDTATVTGQVGSIVPTGAVTFTFDKDACGVSAIANGGTVDSVRSVDTSALAAGSYNFRGSVVGDDNYVGATSSCEPLTVEKAQLSITTTIHKNDHTVIANNSHVPLSTVAHDNADVTGEVVGFPIGAVSFTLNGNPITNDATEVPFDATSINSASLGAGNYVFNASVATNDNYLGATSADEPFIVDKAQLTVTTQVHNSAHADITNTSVAAGSIVHDTATVSGGVVGFTVPTPTFTLTTGYSDSCDEGAVVGNDGMDGLANKSANSSVLGAGSYAYRGVVAGDDNYLGDVSDCEPFGAVDARISINPLTSTNEVNDDHAFTVTVEQNTGAGFVPVPAGTVVNAIVSPATTLNISDCADGVNASGQCDVIVNSSAAGVFTIIARSTVVVSGVTFKLQTNGAGNNSGPAVKTYVDAKISLSPLDATNQVGQPHNVTVTVMKNSGSGFVAAAGEHVDFTLTPTGATPVLDAGLSTCDNAGPNTNASGQCTIVFSSATPGTVTIHAKVDVTINSVVMHRESGDGLSGDSTDANKKYEGGKIIVQKVTVGGDGSFNFNPDYAADFQLGNGGSNDSGFIPTGSHNVSEDVLAGWVNTSATCDGVGNTPASITLGDGQTVTCTFTNTKLAKLTVVKDASPNDCADFAFTLTGKPGFSLDDDAGVADCADTTLSDSKSFTDLNPGSYTIGETQPNSFWTLGSASCVVTGGATPYASNLVGTSLTVNLTAGADVTCKFVNNKLSPSRTLGFWQTHTAYTSARFAAAPISSNMPIGSGIHKGFITTTAQLFGGFFAPIPKTTTGSARSALDKARIQLLQQLIAAKLNCATFGCSATIAGQIANADTAYATGTAAQILAAAAQMDAYNNSGDTLTIGNAGSATPKTSKDIADMAFWNLP